MKTFLVNLNAFDEIFCVHIILEAQHMLAIQKVGDCPNSLLIDDQCFRTRA